MLLSPNRFRVGRFLIHADKAFNWEDLRTLRHGGTEAINLAYAKVRSGIWRVVDLGGE